MVMVLGMVPENSLDWRLLERKTDVDQKKKRGEEGKKEWILKEKKTTHSSVRNLRLPIVGGMDPGM